MKPVIAVTVGDPSGIGPEIAIKAASHKSIRGICCPLLVGPWEVFRRSARLLERKSFDFTIHETESSANVHISPGRVSAESGRVAAAALKLAVALVLQDRAQALVTSPVSKQALHKAGVRFAGQTEFLQHLTGAKHVAMMLTSDVMRVGLVTIHVPVGKIAQAMTSRLLLERIRVIHKGLKTDWGISEPRLAVLGLNPHAGEGGDIGMEERRVIGPVVRKLKHRGLLVDGPFPADSFFGRRRYRHFDAVIAMYHDQGLIPLKMSSSDNAVNVTVGLPFIRTSPDHGTAFDIAGKGIASASSMIQAIRLAVELSHRRNLYRRSTHD